MSAMKVGVHLPIAGRDASPDVIVQVAQEAERQQIGQRRPRREIGQQPGPGMRDDTKIMESPGWESRWT